jgi:hypothetical protein
MFNPATELAICRIFGAKPFDSRESEKIPFSFRAPRLTIPNSSVVEASATGKPGIWLRGPKKLIEADYWPLEEFKQRWIEKGRDAAVVLVCNHRPSPESKTTRKLMVVAGLTGTATEGAAVALVDHFRDLEPRAAKKDPSPATEEQAQEAADNRSVWGVVEVFYRKPRRSVKREIRYYNWLLRVGGRCPVDVVKRPRGRRGGHDSQLP